MVSKVLGLRARFCDAYCRNSFKADRESGLCYGPHMINGVLAMHREEWSLAVCKCAYCGAEVNGKVPDKLKTKFNI